MPMWIVVDWIYLRFSAITFWSFESLLAFVFLLNPTSKFSSRLRSAKDCWKIKVVTTRVRNKQDFILQGLFKSDLFGKDFLMLFYRLSFSASGNWAQEFGHIVIILEIVTDQSSVLLFCQNRTSQSKFCFPNRNQTESNM